MTSSYGLKPLATGSCKAMGQLGVKRDHKLRKRRLVFSALEAGKPTDMINKLNINAAAFLFMVILPVPLLPTSQNQRDVTEESISLEEFQVLRSQMHTGALETSRLPKIPSRSSHAACGVDGDDRTHEQACGASAPRWRHPAAGRINTLIPRVSPHSPCKHLPHQQIIARKTRRIMVESAQCGSEANGIKLSSNTLLYQCFAYRSASLGSPQASLGQRVTAWDSSYFDRAARRLPCGRIPSKYLQEKGFRLT